MKSSSLLGFAALSFPCSSSRLPSAELGTRQAGSSWFLPNLDHTSGPVRGYVPNLVNGAGQPNYTYPVYKAVNSGDSQGLIDALYSDGPSGGQRDNCWLAGQPRVIYLAPDTDTVIIGDASRPPVIKPSAGFNGNYLIVGGQGDVKNVILDTTANSGSASFTALSWAVAQNCALVNVKINMPQGAHTGIVMGGGSTISVSGVQFNFGNVGLHWRVSTGHQQGQIKGMTFNKCTTGILIDSGFTISIFAPVCNTVGNCIVVNSGNAWVAVVDGQSINSGDFFTSRVDFPNFMLENISKDTTNSNMVTVGGSVKVGGVTSLGTYIYGNTRGANPIYQSDPTPKPVSRPAALAPGGRYPVINAPQYAERTASDVVNLKDMKQNGGFNLHGDGSADDTAALQGALNTAASQGKIAYLPFGIYRVTSTVTVPPGTELYGEAWSTISASGSAFSSESSPRPVVQVGSSPGQRGTARIQDVRFTVNEALPGAILLRINMAGDRPGDVAVLNSLNTIGGTCDTSVSCSSEANCRAAYLGLHLAAGSSAYVDNFWSWVADHASDDSNKGIRTAVKGGVLIEATAGTWITGLGSEHNWLYQLSLHNAANVFVSLFQSETNYNQGSHGAPLPGRPFNATASDPDFSWCGGGDDVCRMGLAQYYVGRNSGIYHYAAGSWNFRSLTGVDQGLMNYIQNTVSNGNLHGYTSGPNTAEAMRLPSGDEFGNGGKDGYGGSWGTLIADVSSQV
ncbi:endoglucanase [Metarhizium album ARSEF 1941]|uniref:Endoglucanase n=1 Tax=Metarhizium album (strain ARSEF 1941) TaxID=1081103 RepID=A0A0B2WMI1_METAS|nr:endoglucanase [Metarhizium album ARSEF 1941]KHN97236.1 endoglucanase [Metarhizium album ARSEF 1941]